MSRRKLGIVPKKSDGAEEDSIENQDSLIKNGGDGAGDTDNGILDEEQGEISSSVFYYFQSVSQSQLAFVSSVQ